jgi:hypothetical protein
MATLPTDNPSGRQPRQECKRLCYTLVTNTLGSQIPVDLLWG